MSDDNQDFLLVSGRVLRTSEKAVLFETGLHDEIWIPRSVIEDGDEVEVNQEDIMVRKWFVQKEGL